MAAGIAMTVSYISVIIICILLAGCLTVMRHEQKEEKLSGIVPGEMVDCVGYLTVVGDRRNGRRVLKNLKGEQYPLSTSETIGSSRKADTLISHPAVAKMHVELNYRKPGRVIVKALKNSRVSTNRKAGELMDGDMLILGEGNERLELRLSFIKQSDIDAAKNAAGAEAADGGKSGFSGKRAARK